MMRAESQFHWNFSIIITADDTSQIAQNNGNHFRIFVGVIYSILVLQRSGFYRQRSW